MNAWYENLASEDFAKARTKELLSRISTFIDPERDRLLSLEDVRGLLKPSREVYEGIRAVPVDLIIGSEGRYRDFNRHFLPRREYLKSRWMKIDMAHYEEVPLPPVRLYEIGGVYFVRDGNHRVSVARMRGQELIDAEVSSLDAELRLKPGMTLEELKREVIAFEKRRFYAETDFGKLTGDEHLDFTSPGRYDEVIEHIDVHKYYINQGRPSEIPRWQALCSWYDNVYQPIAAAIEDMDLLPRFPGRTVSDLYVFVVRHWDELKRKYGLSYSVGEAAKDFDRKFGSSPVARIRRSIGNLLERVARQG